MSFSSRNPSPSASALVTLNGVAARTPDGHTLFDDLTLAFGRERTGVVGRNGVGKTTLLRLIAGLDTPAQGAVSRAASIGWLDQTAEPGADERVADTLGVGDAMARLSRILTGDATAEDLDLADWSIEERIEAALADAGLVGLTLDRLTRTLSGGEQTRLRLAGLMLAQPDLLVLDEPTNHLDTEARARVADVVKRWKGGVVVVSHDRALLRRMDRIVELSALGVSVYGGDYGHYAERVATERAAAERDLASAGRDAGRIARDAQTAVERQARRDKAGRAFAARKSEPRILLTAQAERAENTGARGHQLAQKRIAEADAALTSARDRVEQVRALSIPLPPTGLAGGKTVLVLDAVSWSAPNGREVLRPLSLRLTGPERVAITGRNGAGKTTLLKLITGDLPPTSGRVEQPAPMAFLDQTTAILRPDETVFEAYRRLNPEATPNAAHAALARFLFRNVASRRPVGDLSGGERLRAALACVMTGASPPQLLILDEPTNHLDLDSVAAVEDALRGYDGALIVVSHDADFLNALGIERTIRLGG